MDVFLLVVLFTSTIVTLMALGVTSRIASLLKITEFILVAALLSIAFKFHRRIYIIIKTLPRDLKFLYRYINTHQELKNNLRNNATIVKVFKERVRLYPNRTCFIYEGRVWTTTDIDQYSNRIAAVFQNAGYVKGDTVALLMYNKPEYVAVWLGLGKIGVITALINTNLKATSLAHCITVAEVKAIIYTDEFSSALSDISSSIEGITKYKIGGDLSTFTDEIKNLDQLLENASIKEPSIDYESGYHDKLMYIYTSGTTGLPKAAIITNSRFLVITAATYHMLGLKNGSDILYVSTPLYHTSAGIVGTSCALLKGVPTVIRNKFSVSAFWTDCIKYKCTAALYIGEMCRYLLMAPPRPEDTTHSLRIMIGHGMRPQIWKKFVNRFQIKQINEVYGSSEGNANIVNVDSKVGAVGFFPSIIPSFLHPIVIIRVNSETNEPIRDKNGFCIRAEINEPGMFIGFIKTGDSLREFHGYLDKKASQKKIIKDIFTKGDKGFLSGDILVQDEFGYIYFKDRTGDTFRWKGENVSSVEVEAVISNIIQYKDATVYGVQVPGMEGRAGMAAIVNTGNSLDLKALAESLDNALPSYARPIFLRIMKKLELTGTFKLIKVDLQKQAFDPSKIQDKIYFRSGKEYIEITPELYQQIISGSIKF